MKRIYVCHTYYHVFVTMIKELNRNRDRQDKVTLLLSKMSNDFETFKERAEQSGVFSDVIEFDEKRDTFFPELAKYREDRGSVWANMLARIIYTKKFARMEAKYIPVNFKQYDEIYVFCDSDPIGIYLNQNRISYHAVEDGLDTLKPYVQAIYDNRTHFGLKKFMSMKLNLIFMCDGYSKYCIDMEVNDKSVIHDTFEKYKEVSRRELMNSLSEEDREILIKTFIRDKKVLDALLQDEPDNAILILTEPLCSLDVRETIFRDLAEQYGKEGVVFIKPHPRDELDYQSLFKDHPVLDRTIPMELLGLLKEVHFSKVVGVYTQLGMIDFADEKIMLGNDFMDKYEDPEIHRQADIVEAEFSKV